MNLPGFITCGVIATALFVPSVALAQESSRFEQEQKNYENCLAFSRTDPAAAYDIALTWRDTGGALPARHCVALALAALGHYGEAAAELEAMAGDLARGIGWPFAEQGFHLSPGMLADIYAQAGNAWLLADDPNQAVEVFTLGLGVVANQSRANAELLIDRARAQASIGDYEQVIEDLHLAQTMVDESAALYVLEASAFRSLKQYTEAGVALDKAFGLEPGNREGLLERGNLRRATGDTTGAREAWLEYLQLYPGSDAAAAVRRNIDAMADEEG